jgi:hypothetical protein
MHAIPSRIPLDFYEGFQKLFADSAASLVGVKEPRGQSLLYAYMPPRPIISGNDEYHV